MAATRQESRFPTRSRRDLVNPGIFPPGSRQEKKSRHKSRLDSHRESLSSPGSRPKSRLPRDPAGILPTRVFYRRDPVRKEIPLGLKAGIFVFTEISPRKSENLVRILARILRGKYIPGEMFGSCRLDEIKSF